MLIAGYEFPLNSVFLIAFFCAISFCFLAIKTRRVLSLRNARQSHWTHEQDVVRLGGLAVLASTVCALITLSPTATVFSFELILCSAPIFLSGLAEDFGFRIKPKIRLVFGFISSILAVFILQSWLSKTGIDAIDALVSIPLIGASVTVLITVVLAHGYNLVDGLNGLSSGIGIICLASLTIIAPADAGHGLHEFLFSFIGALVAFWIINIFFGSIFLGDGGAYLVGFIVAWVSIYIVDHSVVVSPWACLLISIYPVSDTIITVLRRIRAGKSWAQADKGHLHHILLDFVERRGRLGKSTSNLTATLCLLLPNVGVAAIAIKYPNHSIVCGVAALVFFTAHIMAYRFFGALRRSSN